MMGKIAQVTPSLRWYHWLIILVAGLSNGGGPYVTAGSLTGSFVLVMLAVMIYRWGTGRGGSEVKHETV